MNYYSDLEIGTAGLPPTQTGRTAEVGSHSNEWLILRAWDSLCTFLTGVICAVVYTAIKAQWHETSEIDDNFIMIGIRISLFAGLLAPLIFRPTLLPQLNTGWHTLAIRVGLQVGALMSLLLIIGFFTRTLAYAPRGWTLAWAGAIFAASLLGRLALPRVFHKMIPRDMLCKKIIVAGDREAVTSLIWYLNQTPNIGIKIIGVFHGASDADIPDNYVSDLLEYGERHPVDRILLTLADLNQLRVNRITGKLKGLNVDIVLCPCLSSFVEFPSGPARPGVIPMTLLATCSIGRWGLLLKAMEDKILATFLLLWVLPLMAIITIAIRLDSPGPVLFHQRRHGRNNTEFDILKFRTMYWRGSNPNGPLEQTRRVDERVTRVGYFLRRSSLDELPQLFNVLRGEMSLVGPRPHPVFMRTENRLGSEIIPNYPLRHRVKPGMTGWAQINGYRGATSTAEQIRRRVEYDMFYIENWSVLLDLKILALTPIKLITDNNMAY